MALLICYEMTIMVVSCVVGFVIGFSVGNHHGFMRAVKKFGAVWQMTVDDLKKLRQG